jgi:hypothetical protein
MTRGGLPLSESFKCCSISLHVLHKSEWSQLSVHCWVLSAMCASLIESLTPVRVDKREVEIPFDMLNSVFAELDVGLITVSLSLSELET